VALLERLRSFHRRRIAIPVGAEALVLDVGSGDKPHWRADVLVDRFPDAEHAIQRSGTAVARTPRPLFDADVTDMPFADFPSHLWWCRYDGAELSFEAKRAHAFDHEIESFVRLPAIERELNSLIDRYLDDCVIAIHWTDDLPHRVVGTVDAQLVEQVALANVHHKRTETMVTRVLTRLFVIPLRSKRRREPVLFDSIVKPELRNGRPEVLQPRRYETRSG